MDGLDGVGVDVFGVDGAAASGAAGDAAGGADGEPAAAGADVGDGGAGVELEGVHDAVDLELLVAGGVFEDGEVAGVGGGGGVGRRLWRGGLGGYLRGRGESEGEQGGGNPEECHGCQYFAS